MCVCPSIQHNAIVTSEETSLLHPVNQFAFHVALIVVYLHVGKQLAQLGQIAVERLRTIDARLAD